MQTMSFVRSISVVALLIFFTPAEVWACPICFGLETGSDEALKFKLGSLHTFGCYRWRVKWVCRIHVSFTEALAASAGERRRVRLTSATRWVQRESVNG